MSLSSKILFVDDEEPIRNAFSRSLRRRGFEVDLAKDAWSAMKFAKREPYAVVALDFRMPGLNGLQLRDELRDMQPDATYVLISGNCDLELAIEAVNEHDVSYVIPKPWNIEELASTLNRAMESSWERASARRLAATRVDMTKRMEQLAQDQSGGAHRKAEVLLSVLDFRDAVSGASARRVGRVARMIGEKMDMTGAELDDLEVGGMLRDIGMVVLPDAILDKPGKLTAEEMARVREHPELGLRLIGHLGEFEGVRRVVAEHHERWDGTGYPKQLAGTDIDRCARIVSVSDTLVAIMSDRAHRAGASFEVARDEIVRSSGTQFAPEAVDGFLRVTPEQWAELGIKIERSEAA